MEKVDDVQLINRILSGDDTTFEILVKKYEKNVHTLVWRKIGDFHYAEEITQDTFLKVYHKLATLKDPRRFLSWVYRIATRQCVLFQRKKRIQMRSIKDTNINVINPMAYSQYIVETQTIAATEKRRDVVQRLLSRLPEKELTVVTLHYYQGMTCQEISGFLGVSENTIKSRLYRARQRLKQYEPTIHKQLDFIVR